MSEDRSMLELPWRHAVSFDRSRSRSDERLAGELLQEWGKARGLEAHDFARVIVEEWDFERRAFYGMTFSAGELSHYDEHVGSLRIIGAASRLRGRGCYAGEVMRGKEELYLTTEETEPCPPRSEPPVAPASQ